LPVAPADADSEEVDAELDGDEVGVLELEAELSCEVVEEIIAPDAVDVVAEASSSIEVEESLESSSEKSSEVAWVLLDAADVPVADVVATLPVAAVSGTGLPAEHVASGTPLMMPWFGSPRQQVKSLASLLLPVPPIREPSQQ
jgi:hypothetical protein